MSSFFITFTLRHLLISRTRKYSGKSLNLRSQSFAYLSSTVKCQYLSVLVGAAIWWQTLWLLSSLLYQIMWYALPVEGSYIWSYLWICLYPTPWSNKKRQKPKVWYLHTLPMCISKNFCTSAFSKKWSWRSLVSKSSRVTWISPYLLDSLVCNF